MKFGSLCKLSMILQESCKLHKHHEPLPHHAEPLRSAIYRRTSRSWETGDRGGEQPVAETERDRGYRAFSCTFPRIDGFFPRNTINPFSTHTPPACYVKYSPADLASWGSSHIICEHCLTPNFLHTAPKWIQKDEFAVPVNPCWKINPTNKITRCALEFYIFSA